MTPKEFIEENYFSLTLDCKREIEEIYQALEDYVKAKQLTIPVVVGALFCEDCQKWVKKKCTCGNTRLSLDYTE